MRIGLSFCALVAGLAVAAEAQETRGQILGRVTDPTGAVVAGATVRALNTAALYTIPTAAERAGDLSALLALGSSYQIYDPKTTVPYGSGHFQRSPFPGNIIPQSRLDPIAQNVMKTYLNMAPNTIAKADGTNNYVQALYQINDFLSTVFRFDENISEKHRLFIRGNYESTKEFACNGFCSCF